MAHRLRSPVLLPRGVLIDTIYRCLIDRVIPQDGAERRNQEEERKKVSQQTSRQWFSRQKSPYILFKSTQLMIFYAFSEYFFK